MNFTVNTNGNHEYARQTTLPAGFGASEFTLELWIKPDNTYPVGPITEGSSSQLTNWYSGNPGIYSSYDWWWRGNFLLDGHNNSGDFSGGTFSLQFFNGGRLRWTFGDGASGGLNGGIWAVQNPSSPTLLDGGWHNVQLVRRWTGTSSAQLEMWIDGNLVDVEISTARTDMASRYWNTWSGYPSGQAGWFWGAEKQAAILTNGLSQYEDYKGLVDELRFWNRAKSATELQSNWSSSVTGSEPGLSGRYTMTFPSTTQSQTCNALASSQCMSFVRWSSNNFSTANFPTLP